MLFRSFAAVLSGVLFAQSALAALTVQQVVDNVNIVAAVSGNLNSVLGGLTTSTGPSGVKTMSETVANNFNTIINALGGDVTAMQATPPFPDGVTQPIVDSLRNFVRIHQALLSTVIGKHGIFAQFGSTGPIRDVLRNLEAQIDSFAFAMIDMMPTRRDDVTNDKDGLDSSVGNAISIYEQLCIPSPLYPSRMPVCASA